VTTQVIWSTYVLCDEKVNVSQAFYGVSDPLDFTVNQAQPQTACAQNPFDQETKVGVMVSRRHMTKDYLKLDFHGKTKPF